jgi:hypothetical protein
MPPNAQDDGESQPLAPQYNFVIGNRLPRGQEGGLNPAKRPPQSRSSSLIEVFDRVRSSTRLTMTAQ